MKVSVTTTRVTIFLKNVVPGILSLLAGVWGASAHDSLLIWQDNFLLTSIGNQPAGWTITAEPKTSCEVTGMPGAVDKVLKFNRRRSSQPLSAEKHFSPTGGVVTVQWRFFESESGRGQDFRILGSKGNELIRLFIDTAGNLCLNDSFAIVQPSVVTNQWYKVKLLLQTESGRCDLYLNDVPMVSEVPFTYPTDSIAGICIRYEGTPPGILHVTDFCVSSVPTMPQRKITIYLNRERQRIDGVGFCHEGNRSRQKPYVIDELVQGMLDNNMSLFRDRFPGRNWEPANDDSDPSTITLKNFATGDSSVITTLQRLKVMRNRGITTILGIWNVADWMVTNPEAGNARKIQNLDELAESVCAFLRYGKEKYGLTVNFVDVNETEIVGINIQLSAAEYGDFVKKCGALFKMNGLTTKVNLGSTLKWGEPYVAEMYDDPDVRKFGGHPTYHSYRGTGTELNDNSIFITWGNFRQRIDRNIWCTETDFDAYYWENPERKEYRGAAEMAYNYWRIYYLARTSATAGWFWRPEYVSHQVHRAYMNYFEPGGRIVEASQEYPGIFTVAYKHTGKNRFVLQVLNASSRGGPVTFTGVPDKPLTLIRTSKTGDRFTTVGTFTPAEHEVVVPVEGDSFCTLYGSLD